MTDSGLNANFNLAETSIYKGSRETYWIDDNHCQNSCLLFIVDLRLGEKRHLVVSILRRRACNRRLHLASLRPIPVSVLIA